MNKLFALRCFSLLIFAIHLIACTRNDFIDQLQIQVPSLKENYEKLLIEAQNWEQDAYLYSVSIPISNSLQNWEIVSSFHSITNEKESIIVNLSSDEIITKNIVEHTKPIFSRNPIVEKDWSIDSNEALEILLLENKEAQSFFISHQTHCSSLKLERFLPENDQPVVWSFSLYDCKFDAKYYYLNPLTGDFLDLSRSIIPDSILLTPSP